MEVDDTSGLLPAGSKGHAYWRYRQGTTVFLLAMLCIGVVLVSIGLPNEARIRPYRFYYNCEEYTDMEDFTWTTCECEPPEYEVFLGLAIVGFILMLIGGLPLANLVYQSRKPGDPSADCGW